MLWNEILEEVAKDYPEIEVINILVDAAATQLCLRPTQFDVMVMENMFGDILSDIAALIVLLPAVQNKFKAFAKDYATKNPEKLMQMMASKMGGMDPSKMGGLGGLGGMGGQNPFGSQNPFGGMGGQNPFGGFGSKNNNGGKFGTTIDGQAKTVNSNAKRIPRSANDD